MTLGEPTATAWLLLTVGILLVVCVLLSRVTTRAGLPVFLLFLGIGMLAGSDGIGGIAFEDYGLSFRLGTLALTLILFDGGLNTPLATIRKSIAPASVLATVGVAATAGLVALGGRLLGFSWPEALLLGAVVSSTDAAAVFSVLRGGGLRLEKRVGGPLELESGLNDPVAVILTTALTAVLAGEQDASWRLLAVVPVQLVVGAGCGLLIGLGGRRLLRRARLPAGGLYAVLSLALAVLAFSLPTLLLGSGFLAVYVAGVVVGNASFPFRSGLLRFHDAIAWLSQVSMFLLLGLLVFPSELPQVAWVGLAMGLMLACVARPLVTLLCLLSFRFRLVESLYIGWVGLRGAVPIILATVPVLAGVPGAERLFNVVFFIVVLNAFLPGLTVPWLTRRLGLLSAEPPPPQAVLDIVSHQPLDGEILSFTVRPALPVAGAKIADLPLPQGSLVMLIVRGNRLVAPRGATSVEPGDHVYVFAMPQDRPLIQLLFGLAEEDRA